MPDQTPRDQLAEIIGDTYQDDYGLPADGTFQNCADAVIEAGWRPPARVITDPAELDELPVDSLLQEQEGQRRVWQLSGVDRVGYYIRPWWVTPGDAKARTSDAIDLPAVVLHTPENGDTE